MENDVTQQKFGLMPLKDYMGSIFRNYPRLIEVGYDRFIDLKLH